MARRYVRTPSAEREAIQARLDAAAEAEREQQAQIDALLIGAYNAAEPPLGSYAHVQLEHQTERAVKRGYATLADVRHAVDIAERYPA